MTFHKFQILVHFVSISKLQTQTHIFRTYFSVKYSRATAPFPQPANIPVGSTLFINSSQFYTSCCAYTIVGGESCSTYSLPICPQHVLNILYYCHVRLHRSIENLLLLFLHGFRSPIIGRRYVLCPVSKGPTRPEAKMSLLCCSRTHTLPVINTSSGTSFPPQYLPPPMNCSEHRGTVRI